MDIHIPHPDAKHEIMCSIATVLSTKRLSKSRLRMSVHLHDLGNIYSNATIPVLYFSQRGRASAVFMDNVIYRVIRLRSRAHEGGWQPPPIKLKIDIEPIEVDDEHRSSLAEIATKVWSETTL